MFRRIVASAVFSATMIATTATAFAMPAHDPHYLTQSDTASVPAQHASSGTPLAVWLIGAALVVALVTFAVSALRHPSPRLARN